MESDLFDSSTNREEEQFEEELTAAEVLQKLEEAWLNEKHSPELQDSKIEIVECLLDQINTMEENLVKLKKGDVRIPVHRMEIQRIKFMINSYLRHRLSKIQKNIFSITKPDSDNPDKMTAEEAEFAGNYRQLLQTHFDSLILRHIPGHWDPTKVSPVTSGPALDSAVFVSVKKSVAGVDIKDATDLGRDDSVDFSEGNQHIVQYSAVSHLVDSEHLQLI